MSSLVINIETITHELLPILFCNTFFMIFIAEKHLFTDAVATEKLTLG
jgi:hypothetical protein